MYVPILVLQHLDHFNHAPFQSLRLTLVARRDHSRHMRMRRVKENLEVAMPDFVDDPQHFRGLVECESRLKFPHHENAGLLSQISAPLPRRDDALERDVQVDLSKDCRRIDAVHTHGWHFEVASKAQMLLERFDVSSMIAGADEAVCREVWRIAGNAQAKAGNQGSQVLPVAVARVIIRMGMWTKTDYLHAIKLQFRQSQNHFLKRNRIVPVGPKNVRPTADRYLFFHTTSP